jgi:mycothiol synthase
MDPALEEIIHAATRADATSPVDEATTLAILDGRGHLDTIDGAFSFVHGDELTVVVHPAQRRRGLGGLLVDRAGPAARTAWSHGNHPAAARLAASRGWERVRDLWVMRRPAGTPVPDVEVSGVEIRGYRATDADELLRVNAAAFADHPEQGAMDLPNLERRMAEPWFDPAGLLVADTGSGLAGFHWTKQHSHAQGEVYVVGVDPSAQGTGLGRALTAAGLHHLDGLGVSEVILYVEATNTRAVALYGKLGFTHHAVDTHVQYRRA